ncbi:MAG: tryptophanase [Oligoflexia bacterium]|nr:tryptophanase [Oligoflexia bacterium]
MKTHRPIQLPTPKTIIEPFRIKMIEPIGMLRPEERVRLLAEAGYNVFKLPAEAVTFDLLTDSGTSAMSAQQWSAMMAGDESYAGAKSFYNFERAVKDLTGMRHVIPTHQGRAAESLLMKAMLKPGQIVIGNTHFDTTRANIESAGGIAKDMPCKAAADSGVIDPFKGNINTEELDSYLKENKSKVGFVIMTVTNNSLAGQPVAMGNLRAAKEIAKKHGIPFFLDVARFAENSYFIKTREADYSQKTVKEIAQEMFSLADGALMSSKKDAFGNIGGFLALNNNEVAEAVRTLMVITEGFPTYGGLAGRDLEALAVGLEEVLDENYLAYRIRSIQYFGEGIEAAGLKIVKPLGGHAVYIDAGKTLPHIPALKFPGQALSVALYEHIGIRCCEVGSVMLGHRDAKTGVEHPAPVEQVRLAIPRRVYTQSHVDYMIEMIGYLAPYLGDLPGYEFEYQAPMLRHFSARFRRC